MVVALVATLSVGVATPARAHGVADQSIDGDPACDATQFPGRAPVTSEAAVVAQGMTPRLSRLQAVDLCLEVLASQGGVTSATLSIVELDEESDEVVRTVATQSFTPDGGGALGAGTRWNHVDLADPVDLVPGAPYAIRLESPRLGFHWRATCGSLVAGCEEGAPDRYASGAATPIEGNADFGFRTWATSAPNLLADVTAPPLVCPDARSLADTVVVVGNEGEQHVSGFDVELFVADASEPLGRARVPGLAAGQDVALVPADFGITDETPVSVATGRTSLRAVVDVGDEIPETTTEDNVAEAATTAVPCAPSALEDVTVSPGSEEVPAGIVEVPFSMVDATVLAANAARFADVSAAPLHSTPFHSTPLHSTPFHSTPLRSTPLHSTPFHSTPLYSTPLRSTPLHSTPLHSTQLDVLFASVPTTVLDQMGLASVPSAVDWTDRLRAHAEAHEGTATAEMARALLDRPNQDRTLADVLRRLSPPLPVGYHEVDVTTFDLSLLGVAMAGQPLSTLPPPDGHASWCDALAAVSHLACGGDVDPDTDTLLTLDVLGAPMHQLDVRGIRVVDVQRRLTPLFDAALADDRHAAAPTAQPYRVSQTPLGALRVDEALADPTLVPACAGGCDLTLAEVEDAHGFATGARVGDLVDALAPGTGAEFGLADALLGMVALADLPWGRFDADPLDAVDVGEAVGEPCPPVAWTVAAQVRTEDPGDPGTAWGPVADPVVDVRLPRGFDPTGEVTATADGATVPTEVEEVVDADGRTRVRIAVDAIVQDAVAVTVPACASATLGWFTVDADATWAGFDVTDGALRLVGRGLDDPPSRVAPVRVVERDEVDTGDANRAPVHERLVLRHVTGPDDPDFLTVPLGTPLDDAGTTLGPGDRLRVHVSPPAAVGGADGHDVDLALFGPDESPLRDAPLRSTPLRSTSMPVVPVDDSGVRSDATWDARDGDVVHDTTVQAEPVQVAPLRSTPFRSTPFHSTPLRSTSTNRGDAPEYADVQVRPGETTGAWTIQVTGHDGDAADRPYAVWYEVLDQVPVLGPCTPPDASFPAAESLGPIADVPAGARTVVLVDGTTLARDAEAQWQASPELQATWPVPGAYAEAVRDRLDDLVAHPQVEGVVLDVDRDPAVNALLRTWRTTSGWCDPVTANEVVGELRRVVADAADASGELANVVVVGGDDVLPMLRSWDETEVANERAYLAEHLSALGAENGPSLAALAAGTVLSDDALGGAGMRWRDDVWFIPQQAVGRLVETPLDVMLQVDQFLLSDGRLDASSMVGPAVEPAGEAPLIRPVTGLVTGYDFLTDGSQDAIDALASAGVDVTGLNRDDWTADDLVTALATGAERVVALPNGHADPTRLLSAEGDRVVRSGGDLDPAEVVSTTDLADVPLGRLVAAASCHLGLNVADRLAVDGVDPARLLDWPELLGQRQAVLMANTGYGYGVSEQAPALSEGLVAGLAGELFATASVGEAWTRAKQAFALSPAVYGEHHRKSGTELVLYGLPMYRLSTAVPDDGAAVEPTVVDDGYTGLDVVDVTTGERPVGASGQDCAACLRRHDTADGSWFEVTGDEGSGVLAVEGQPLTAQATLELDLAGREAGGLFLTAIEVEDVPGPGGDDRGFDPVFARPIVSSSAAEPEPQALGSAFPAAVSSARTVGDRTFLSIPMTRFRGASVRGDGAVVGQLTALTRVDGRLYLREPGTDDGVPPTARQVRMLRSPGVPGEDVVVVRASLLDRSDVGRVAATLRVVGDEPSVRRVELGRVSSEVVPVEGDGTTTRSEWSATVRVPSGAALDVVMVQGVDGVGNVGTYHDKLLAPAVQVAIPGEDPALEVIGEPVGGWYPAGTQVVLSGTSDAYDVWVDGVRVGTFTPGPSGSVVIATLDGSGTVEVRAVPVGDPGAIGTVLLVPMDSTPPELTFVDPTELAFEGGLVVPSGTERPLDVRCHDAGAGVDACTWAVHRVGPDGELDEDPVVVDPTTLPTDRVGRWAVVARAVDGVGHETTHTVTYEVESRFSMVGFEWPLRPFPGVRDYPSGEYLPVVFRMFEGDTPVEDPRRVTLRWFPIGEPTDGTCTVPSREVLDHRSLADGEPVTTWSHGWSYRTYLIVKVRTSSSWEGTCRVLVAEAPDGARLYGVVRMT